MPEGKKRNFIEKDAFADILAEVARRDGESYEDVPTIYGDMSRLIVAWLAETSPQKIQETYRNMGWHGNANARALHEAAKHWMELYRPPSAKKHP